MKRYKEKDVSNVLIDKKGENNMTQDERWKERYDEVVGFIKANHRNPIPEQALASFQWQATRSSSPTRSLSKHRVEDHLMVNWIKANRKALNAGKMQGKRLDLFNEIFDLSEEYRKVNQYV